MGMRVMFELEIMVTGYTIVVATTSVVISKCICKKRLNNIRDELSFLKSDLLKAEAEIKRLKNN
jgi:hypothetical protein